MFNRGLVFGAQPETGAAPDVTTLYDQSRYKNNGTTWSGPTWSRLPSGLWVLNFDGIDDRVSLPSSPSLSLGWPALSMVVWAKPNTLSGGGGNWRCAISSDTVGQPVFGLRSSSGGAMCLSKKGIVDATVGSIPAVNTWSQLAFAFDSVAVANNLTYYLNSAATIVSYNIDFTLGASVYHIGMGEGVFSGSLALPRVYNYALSADMVKALWESERRWFGV